MNLWCHLWFIFENEATALIRLLRWMAVHLKVLREPQRGGLFRQKWDVCSLPVCYETQWFHQVDWNELAVITITLMLRFYILAPHKYMLLLTAEVRWSNSSKHLKGKCLHSIGILSEKLKITLFQQSYNKHREKSKIHVTVMKRAPSISINNSFGIEFYF